MHAWRARDTRQDLWAFIVSDSLDVLYFRYHETAAHVGKQ